MREPRHEARSARQARGAAAARRARLISGLADRWSSPKCCERRFWQPAQAGFAAGAQRRPVGAASAASPYPKRLSSRDTINGMSTSDVTRENTTANAYTDDTI